MLARTLCFEGVRKLTARTLRLELKALKPKPRAVSPRSAALHGVHGEEMEVEAKRLLFVLLYVVSVFSVVDRLYLAVLKEGGTLCLRGRLRAHY